MESIGLEISECKVVEGSKKKKKKTIAQYPLLLHSFVVVKQKEPEMSLGGSFGLITNFILRADSLKP
jgi:hypothetical protein